MGLLRQPTGDITQGVIWKQLIGFFFPLWFGTFFQQLYNTVDTLVVGRFVGKVALAAVGSTGVIVNLTVGIFTGVSAGAVVIIAQQFGARKWEDVHKSVHTTMLLGVIVGAFFMVAGFILTPWALRAMGTTEEAMPGAVLYLRVYFLGMVPNVVYNMGTGVLRAIGDFRRPLYFLIAASGCNIVLDLLLVLVFHLDVAGVAIATICSQLLSAVLVVVALLRSEMTPYQLFPRQLHIHPEPMRGILHIGVPTALQSVMYSASNIVIQAAINSFGTDTVAAWTAYGKMDVIFSSSWPGPSSPSSPPTPPCWTSAWTWCASWPPATSPTSSLSSSPAPSGGRASRWGPCSSTCSACAACAWPGSSWWCPSTTP